MIATESGAIDGLPASDHVDVSKVRMKRDRDFIKCSELLLDGLGVVGKFYIVWECWSYARDVDFMS